ncbi:competence protein ComA [Seminibacterium arietis]|uniref:Competence protein ComA n=1 Tax=Seminibacterium arietis TaxID=1173502 RepID=A0ABW3I993_9PAST
MSGFTQKSSLIIQVGLYKTENTYQCLWFDQKKVPHFMQSSSHLSIKEIQSQLNASDVVDNKIKKKPKFIVSIQPQHIWTRSLLLPHLLTPQESEQQCHFLLENELPTPLEQLWFDYCTTPLKQSCRLDIFAIIKNTAKDYLKKYSPLLISVLDSHSHAIVRAFQYLLNLSDEEINEKLFLYKDSECCLAIQQKSGQFRTVQHSKNNILIIFEHFCQRYNERPTEIYFYSTSEIKKTPQQWNQVNTDLPFIALGNALWRQE